MHIPIFFPVPFKELSSVQYYSVDEQLTQLTAALNKPVPAALFYPDPATENAAHAWAVRRAGNHVQLFG